jgi:lipopolysaccharide exporter
MSIARQAAHGVAWNMALGVSTRVLQLVGTLILTRFIAPDDYGTVLTASIAILTVGAFTSFSFGQYLIAKRAPAEVAIQAMVVYVGIGLIALSLLYALRVPIGNLFDTPDMGKYVLGFAIAQLLDRARYVPERLIIRSLRFRALATINGIGEMAYTATAVASAHMWGPYAIVFGFLARSVITSILFFYAAPREEWLVRPRLRAADIRDLFAYGIPLMIAVVADRAATRWDNLIMSKLFSPGVMGRYNLAYSLAEMPIINVAEHIGEVLMPSFSRMDPDQRPRAAVRAAALMGLVVSPLGIGLGAIAPTVVDTFFDPRWAMMAPMLTILSIMTVFRPMIWSVLSLAQAAQNTRLVMVSCFVRAIVVLTLVAVCGAAGGPNWACVGAGIGYALHTTLTIVIGGRAIGLPTAAYLGAVARPLLPCIPMYIAVVALHHGLAAADVPRPVSLVAQLVAGAIIYTSAAFVLVRPGVDDLLRIGREAIRSRRSCGSRS